jgi:hypothetical protein
MLLGEIKNLNAYSPECISRKEFTTQNKSSKQSMAAVASSHTRFSAIQRICYFPAQMMIACGIVLTGDI